MLVKPLLQSKSKQYYILWVCVCSLRYAAYNAYAPYCNLWPAQLYNIFPHLTNGMIFERKKKELFNKKCMFWLSVRLLSHTFLILGRIQRDISQKCVLVFMCSTFRSCQTKMNLKFFSTHLALRHTQKLPVPTWLLVLVTNTDMPYVSSVGILTILRQL